MKILMTGGTGLIGKRFIERFGRHELTVLSRDPARAAKLLPGNVKVVASLSEFNDLDDFDAVINLAGEPIIDKRWSAAQKKQICDSRWDITRQLVELFNQGNQPPGVFLSGSAIGFYGEGGDRSLTETDTAQEIDFPVEICREWEAIARQVEDKTRLILLRTGIVLDQKGGALSKMLLPFKLCLGGKIGSGKQYMSWIHIDDMTGAMEYLLHQKEARGPFNLVAPAAVTNATFVQTLASTLNRIAVLPAPAFVLKLLLGESSVLLLGSQRVAPLKLSEQGFSFQYPELPKALAHLLGK